MFGIETRLVFSFHLLMFPRIYAEGRQTMTEQEEAEGNYLLLFT